MSENQNDIAIEVAGVQKIYKLYDHRRDRLKETLGFSKKKRHRDHYALKGVDFTVKNGECVGIIGTNGSGKSTILKIITGVLTPSSGTVTVNGRISALLELGAGFNPEYNGIENIYLNGTMIGFTEEEIKERIQDILDFADIGEYVYQPVKTYSSGMFVRLAFAVAINIDPEILIVDEALSVGDVFFQAKCYHKFEEFKKQGKTILFVSHDLGSISKYCDRVILLNQGAKLGEGTPKEMIDIYKQVLVGQYQLPDTEQGNLLRDKDIEKAASTQGVPHSPNAGRSVSPAYAGTTAAAEAGDKKSTDINEDTLEYGSRKATIFESYVTDENGMKTTAIVKGREYTVHMKVRFNESCQAPIFAYTVKNIKGIEITGTNTMVEKAFLDPVDAGECKEIAFTQRMTLQGGEYLISFGVTGFEGENFTVYHRLYDAVNVTVVSDKDTVGYYDSESKVVVMDVKN